MQMDYTIHDLSVPQKRLTKLIPLHERRAGLSAKSQKRAEEVLSAARQMFSEVGYEKTTTLEIAQRLGISEATVFTYFSSKRELCMQVINDWYAEMSDELEKELPRIQGTRSQLAYIVQKHLNALIRDGQGLCALVLTEGRSPDSGFSELLAHLQRRYTAPLMSVLFAAQASEEIRSDMPLRLMRDMVYGSMEHILWECIISRRIPDLEATACQVTEMLWSAFAPPNTNLNALRQLQAEVADALRRFEST
jgi:AcrR family transcriptional regulator